MKKIIILLLLALSCLAVSAQAFDFKITSIRSEIEADESAQFLITIDSNLTTIKELKVYSPEVEWDVPSDIIKVYPEKTTEYKLVLTPLKYVEPGKIYGIKIYFKNTKTDEIIYSDIVQVNVKSTTKTVSAYRPSVRMAVDMPTNIDPSGPVNVKVKLENQNLLNLSDLRLNVYSEAEGFQTEQDVKLIPLGKKILELNYNIDPLQDPGEYGLTFELVEGNEIIERKVKPINIVETTPEFKVEESEEGFFFKNTINRQYISESNVEDTQTIKIPTTTIKSWFISTSPESQKITEGENKYLVIDLTLKPGESKEITITTSYRILIYILIIAGILLYVYYRYKSPISIEKTVSDVNTKEGGISELKVTLELKNSANKTIKKATVTDYVPNISSIKKEFSEGTLKPSRIFKHKTKGTIMKWDIEDIAPGEDRLISYTMKSKLSIVGDFKVPRAKITFKKKGREITSYSNSVGVSTP
ncbi:hypothetical protein GF361_02415 [Candidatus Woesearchaeota archaeon]|nr:hypothetical protein [Candidatus Woesearchaeota archaeon]